MGLRQLILTSGEDAFGEKPRAYFWGTAIMVIGGLIFISGFLAAVTSVGDIDDLQSYDARGRSMVFRSFVGVALIGVGKYIRSKGVGRRSGSRSSSPGAGHSIMIRCLACDHLNVEDSKFCNDCGAPMRARG